MHLPVKFGIGGGISHDVLIDSLDSCFSRLVCLNSSINLSSEGVEVLLVLGFNFGVLGLVLLEPSNNLSFVEIECESSVMHGSPLSFSGGSIEFLVEASLEKGESSEVEHGDHVSVSWVELVLKESLDFWNDVGDVSSMEVSVGGNVGNNLIVSVSEDCLSCFNEWSEHDPVVFVEGFKFEREMFKRSVPVSHEEIVLSLETESPFVDGQSVEDENEIIVDTVSAFVGAGNDINVLSGGVCGHNFLFSNDFQAFAIVMAVLGKGKGGDERKGSVEFHYVAVK